jgi:hypothetical protein
VLKNKNNTIDKMVVEPEHKIILCIYQTMETENNYLFLLANLNNNKKSYLQLIDNPLILDYKVPPLNLKV